MVPRVKFHFSSELDQFRCSQRAAANSDQQFVSAAQRLRRWRSPTSRGLIMNAMETLWPMWAIAAVFAFAFRQEAAVTVAGVSWWHRILGGIVAVVFFGMHLGLLK